MPVATGPCFRACNLVTCESAFACQLQVLRGPVLQRLSQAIVKQTLILAGQGALMRRPSGKAARQLAVRPSACQDTLAEAMESLVEHYLERTEQYIEGLKQDFSVVSVVLGAVKEELKDLSVGLGEVKEQTDKISRLLNEHSIMLSKLDFMVGSTNEAALRAEAEQEFVYEYLRPFKALSVADLARLLPSGLVQGHSDVHALSLMVQTAAMALLRHKVLRKLLLLLEVRPCPSNSV